MLLKFFKMRLLSLSDRGSRFRGVYQTAKAASAMYIRPRNPYISNNYLYFLSEFEAIFETALAHKSGPLAGLFDEKNRGSKISCHCPFKAAIGTFRGPTVRCFTPGVQLIESTTTFF
jgi:hypothetical protein